MVKTLIDKNQTLVNEVNKTLNQVLELEKLLSAKTKERNDINALTSQLTSQYQSQNANIKQLTLQKAKGMADQDSLKSNIEAAKNGFMSILDLIKEEYSVGTDFEPLENARAAVFDGDQPDIMKCNGALFEAYPLT